MLKQSNNSLLHIATIGKTVGFKGELKLHIHSDFPEQFKKGVSFFINEKDTLTINSIDIKKSLISFIGYPSDLEAKKLTNKDLFTTIERSRAECKLENGEYFWFDLIGCSIVENGEILGVVSEIERIVNTNYLCVKTDVLLVNSGFTKSFLIPHLVNFVLAIDIQKRVIKVSGAKDILEAS